MKIAQSLVVCGIQGWNSFNPVDKIRRNRSVYWSRSQSVGFRVTLQPRHTMPTPARQWATQYLFDHPEAVTVRLGLGLPGERQHRLTVWTDIIDQEGRHMAASQQRRPPRPPPEVVTWAHANIPIGEWVDFQCDSNP